MGEGDGTSQPRTILSFQSLKWRQYIRCIVTTCSTAKSYNGPLWHSVFLVVNEEAGPLEINGPGIGSGRQSRATSRLSFR